MNSLVIELERGPVASLPVYLPVAGIQPPLALLSFQPAERGSITDVPHTTIQSVIRPLHRLQTQKPMRSIFVLCQLHHQVDRL